MRQQLGDRDAMLTLAPKLRDDVGGFRGQRQLRLSRVCAATGIATPKVAAANFVSEEQPENGYLALSLSRQARRRPDVRRASRLHRAEWTVD
jgi:hypothetical protein